MTARYSSSATTAPSLPPSASHGRSICPKRLRIVHLRSRTIGYRQQTCHIHQPSCESPMFGIDPSFLSSLAQVIMIDLVLAGDNAVVIGLAAAGLAPDLRKRAVLIGIMAATVLRIFFALITTQLLSLGGGLLIAGGLLLLWVCWKMY